MVDIDVDVLRDKDELGIEIGFDVVDGDGCDVPDIIIWIILSIFNPSRISRSSLDLDRFIV